jgi:hypothetical protein
VLGTGIIFGFRLQAALIIAIAFAVFLFKHKHYAEDVASVAIKHNKLIKTRYL